MGDIDKIKRATTIELVEQFDLAQEELSNQMYPVSGFRSEQLNNYKNMIYEELKRRK